MAVYKRGYQRYDGPITGHATRMLAMPRAAWKRLFEQRLMIVLLAVACIWPLLCGVFIYVANHAELWSGIGRGMARILEINGRFFLTFMQVQATFSVLLAALAGPGLIAPDLANNALPLYFSRPLSRLDYALARLTTLFGLLSLVTWVPGLVLFGIHAGMAPAGWLWTHWHFAVAIVAGFLVWIAVVSLVALASSAYVKWRLIAGALILGFFFVLAGASEMINGIFRVDWGGLINPTRAAYSIWCSMLGVETPAGLDTPACIMVLSALICALAWILERKLRPVEVIS